MPILKVAIIIGHARPQSSNAVPLEIMVPDPGKHRLYIYFSIESTGLPVIVGFNLSRQIGNPPA